MRVLDPIGAVHWLRERVAVTIRDTMTNDEAPARDPWAPDDDDPGLFGPDSVTWRIHQDSSMLVGGLRALFLQTMHPLAMAGVADHSNYREDAMGRLGANECVRRPHDVRQPEAGRTSHRRGPPRSPARRRCGTRRSALCGQRSASLDVGASHLGRLVPPLVSPLWRARAVAHGRRPLRRRDGRDVRAVARRAWRSFRRRATRLLHGHPSRAPRHDRGATHHDGGLLLLLCRFQHVRPTRSSHRRPPVCSLASFVATSASRCSRRSSRSWCARPRSR